MVLSKPKQSRRQAESAPELAVSKVLRYFAFYLSIGKEYHRTCLDKHQVLRKRERTYYTEPSTFVELYILRSFVYFSQAKTVRRKS